MIRFHDSTLFISARSPFARRVRLAFREHDLSYREVVEDVFHPSPALLAASVWAKVPVLCLADGGLLTESEKILGLFYERGLEGQGSPLAPRNDAEALEVATWSALGVGFCERMVEFFLEGMRPVAHRDPDVIAEFEACALRFMAKLEGHLVDRDWMIPGHLTQADLDLGAGLAYYTLRVSQSWMATYPRVAAYGDCLEARPAFQATRPPSPV